MSATCTKQVLGSFSLFAYFANEVIWPLYSFALHMRYTALSSELSLGVSVAKLTPRTSKRPTLTERALGGLR
jgi:hypothetical protein